MTPEFSSCTSSPHSVTAQKSFPPFTIRITTIIVSIGLFTSSIRTMAIIHTPRTLVSIARGLLRKRRQQQQQLLLQERTTIAKNTPDEEQLVTRFRGFLPSADPHVYLGKAHWMWDLDYLGHMNNASYLVHAEYARWEWTAEMGVLEKMIQTKTSFVVTNSALRFRKEIRASKNDFEIHTTTQAIDEKYFWLEHVFRAPSSESKGRILAQVLCQAVAVQGGKIVPPMELLRTMGIPKDRMEPLMMPRTVQTIQKFYDLDQALRTKANKDDERIRETQ